MPVGPVFCPQRLCPIINTLKSLLVTPCSGAGLAEWLLFVALTISLTLATTWLALFFGLLAKTMEGAGAFSYILIFLVFISSGFTPVDKMRLFSVVAENQSMTPIIERMHFSRRVSLEVVQGWLLLGVLVFSSSHTFQHSGHIRQKQCNTCRE